MVLIGCQSGADPQRDACCSALDAFTQTDASANVDAAVDAAVDADIEPDPFAVTERVELVTSMGSFVIALYGNGAPITVANFLSYVDAGSYANVIFHRVIAGFMIQGGGLYENMTGAPTQPPIVLEILDGLSHQPGVISMARTSAPNSATNQFFICVADDSFLDGDYAAFGAVESGYDVVEAISAVQTGSVPPYDDVPLTPVVILSTARLGQP
ncbi:MAG: peptidylprolyl isomerase [bacterium]